MRPPLTLLAALALGGCSAAAPTPDAPATGIEEPEAEEPPPSTDEPQTSADAQPEERVVPEDFFAVRSRSELGERFDIDIFREFSTEHEAARIRESEQLCPDQQALRRAFVGPLPTTVEPGTCLWWSSAGGWTRTPFAVTEGALEHFVERAGALSDDETALASGIDSVRLAYVATYERQEIFVHQGRPFNDAEVVRLELSWSRFGPDTLIYGFTLIRVVVFREDEEPVVLGDGEIEQWTLSG